MTIKNLDPQLNMICKLLSEIKIDYCIDSGTLLGLIREGELLTHDLDIDIFVHHNQQNKIIEIKNRLVKMSYKYRILNHYGKKYKYKFWLSSEKRVLDINIFRETNDNKFYVCPQPFPIIKDENFFIKNFRKLIRVSFGFMKSIGTEFDLNDFPWKIGTYHQTWVVPKEYFERFDILDNGVCIPNKAADYLGFRYGNWRAPNSNWNFRTDDKGLSEKSPLEFNCFEI